MSNQAFDAYDECVEKLEKAEAERDEARAELRDMKRAMVDEHNLAFRYREALERIADNARYGSPTSELSAIARTALNETQEQER